MGRRTIHDLCYMGASVNDPALSGNLLPILPTVDIDRFYQERMLQPLGWHPMKCRFGEKIC